MKKALLLIVVPPLAATALGRCTAPAPAYVLVIVRKGVV